MNRWMDRHDWPVGMLWDVTVWLNEGNCCVMIMAQEGFPQQQLGQETALRDTQRDMDDGNSSNVAF